MKLKTDLFQTQPSTAPTRIRLVALWAIFALFLGPLSACDEATQAEPNLLELGGEVDENGKPTLGHTGWSEPAGKEDSTGGRRGLPTSVDQSPTAVWEVTNAWADTDTPQARKAGVAWAENSGLDWEQKYRAWISSFERIDSTSYGETFLLKTPWGTTLPAPSLECAEVVIFLRVVFASWYGLPYFMEATDAGKRLYFGHFGIRTENGRWNNMPNFKTSYADYSADAQAFIDGEIDWPSDPKLAGMRIPGSFDDSQPMLESINGEVAHAGAYFDRIFLNKRVGYFMRLHLIYFGSINLADSVNTFNLHPDAIQAGDLLLERWQRTGIGHALAVMRTRDLGTQEVAGQRYPQLEAELASGSMPRRQPKWDSAAASKRYFTMNETGGPGYETLGGGLKRWRQATRVDGRWTNIVAARDRDAFINANSHAELAERPARFETILTELDTDAKIDVILGVINDKRAHLQSYPASCAARIGREDAFKDLYEVAAELNLSPQEVDRRYRRFEDYVFAELVYSESKTCCWNASTPAMYDLIIEYNLNQAEDPETGTCQALSVFKARDEGGDGYERFRAYAESVSQADAWVPWSAGESCPQANVRADREAEHRWAPFCAVSEEVGERL